MNSVWLFGPCQLRLDCGCQNAGKNQPGEAVGHGGFLSCGRAEGSLTAPSLLPFRQQGSTKQEEGRYYTPHLRDSPWLHRCTASPSAQHPGGARVQGMQPFLRLQFAAADFPPAGQAKECTVDTSFYFLCFPKPRSHLVKPTFPTQRRGPTSFMMAREEGQSVEVRECRL